MGHVAKVMYSVTQSIVMSVEIFNYLGQRRVSDVSVGVAKQQPREDKEVR